MQEGKNNVTNQDVIRLIGTIWSGGNQVGYQVMHIRTRNFIQVPNANMPSLLRSHKCENAILKDGQIVNTECSMDRLLKFDTRGNITDNKGLTVLGEVSRGDSEISYYILDHTGKFGAITESKLIAVIERNALKLLNAKVVNMNGKKHISAIRGTFREYIDPSSVKKRVYGTSPTKENAQVAKKLGSEILLNAAKCILHTMSNASIVKLGAKSSTLLLQKLLGLELPNKDIEVGNITMPNHKIVGVKLVSTIPTVVPIINTALNNKTGLNPQTDIGYRMVNPNVEFYVTMYEFMFLIIRPEYSGFCNVDGNSRGAYYASRLDPFFKGEVKFPTPSINFTSKEKSVRDASVLEVINDRNLIKPKYAEKFGALTKKTIVKSDTTPKDYLSLLTKLAHSGDTSPLGYKVPFPIMDALVMNKLFTS